MNHDTKPSAQCLTPILCVRDFREAKRYYTKKLFFDLLWEWDKPPSFGSVRLGNVEIFFCLQGQGQPGMWMSIFMDDVDDYFERISKAGAEVISGPKDYPWGWKSTCAIPISTSFASAREFRRANRNYLSSARPWKRASKNDWRP
jgi:predicted enzyme related to lactoylglutathione lyase